MTRGIEAWLQEFREAWMQKDIDSVMQLFTDDVEYFETPFQRLEKGELREEWRSIRDQESIGLEFEIFASEGKRHTVVYSFECIIDGEDYQSEGVYLIKLNSEGLCEKFRQYPVEE